MSNISKNDILEAVANMSVMDVCDLIKSMEEKFGVSASEILINDTIRELSNREGMNFFEEIGGISLVFLRTTMVAWIQNLFLRLYLFDSSCRV